MGHDKHPPAVIGDEKPPDVERDAESESRESSQPRTTLDREKDDGRTAEAGAADAVRSPTTPPPEQRPPSPVASPPPPPNDEPANPEAGRTRLQTTLIVSALASALFLVALDMTIVTTAVPTIAAQFGSNLGYTWVGSSYLLANAATVTSWGKVSDIWGRKPVLLVATAVFWFGSLLSGVARSMGMLIAARAVQGVGGGGIIVLVNICISDLFSIRNRGVYFGFMGMVWAFASAVGPILGGVFTSTTTWRWCFFLNLPISGVAMAILVFVLKLHNPRTPVGAGLAAVDWLGSITIIGATLMILLGLEFGGIVFPWDSATVVCLLVFGVLTTALFVLNEWKFAKYPVMPMRLFSVPSNLASLGVCFFHGAVFMSGSYYLPLYFQAVLGANPLLSGVYLVPYSMALSIVSTLSGFVMRKTGKYLPNIIAGMVICTLGFGLFIDLGPEANWGKIIGFQIIAGIGVGPNFQAPLISLQTMVEPRDIATATATFGFVRQMATSISVVLGGVVFQNEMQRQFPALLAQLGPDLANLLAGNNAGASVSLVGRLTGREGEIAREAYWKSLRTMFIMYVGLSAAGLVISFFVGSRKLSKDHKEHQTGLTGMLKKGEDDQKKSADAENGQTSRRIPVPDKD